MDLESTTNGVYSLKYHLIFVVKYRRKILEDPNLILLLKTVTRRVAEEHIINIKEMETDKDHIHILFSCKPTINLIKFIKEVKGKSSRALRLKYPNLKEKVHKDSFWSPSYFLCTTGGVTIEIIEQYIKNQGN
ncbi:MAG: IS200/IS605 family transposase [Methanobrevibacter sp.]|jgi:putative transposase|nr:IS200/IS605 family transposase [Candidatus Methanovirga basalitermitum]